MNEQLTGERIPLPHEQRVIDEMQELNGKIDKLEQFIAAKHIFNKISQDERDRLRKQLGFMVGYSMTLTDRIKAFG